jgi:hypothetical protein
MAQIDPYATTSALSEGYNFMQGIAQDRARRQAGNALASGDVNQAMSALGGAGDLQSVQALQSGQRKQAAEDRAAEEEDRKQRLAFVGQAARAIMQAPPDQRDAVWQQVRPVFQQMGFPDDLLLQLDQAPKTDENLRSVVVAAGGEVESPFANDVTVGGARLRPNRYTGEYTPAYEAPFDPREGAGPGYMWADETRTRQTYIPGGPADPGVVSTRAAAGRAPPRARSGDGGSRSSGGSPREGGGSRSDSRYEYF